MSKDHRLTWRHSWRRATSYLVEQRAKDIGVHVALGATTRDAERLVLVLEDWLVHRVLGSPERVLFHGAKSWHAKMLFPGYHAPLANHVIARCRERATEDGIVVDDVGELFQLARNSEHVTGDAQTMARLETFLGLYGFARNISFACLFLAPLLVVSARLSHRPHILDFAIAATVIGVAFVYRFLMFYRLYSVAVFNRFGSTL